MANRLNIIFCVLTVIIVCFNSYSQERKKIPIPTLFNTGIDDSKALLADGETDPHYFLLKSADDMFPGPETKIVYSDGFPMDCWIRNDDQSKWIAPRADAGAFNSAGIYIYNLSFSLHGFKPETAEIHGRWTSDNNGVDIIINNGSTGFRTDYNAFGSGFYPFEIKKGFIKGDNSILFIVYNGEAPTGLRVEIYGEAEPEEYTTK